MAIKKLLGINFGLDALDIVEMDKQKILSSYHISYIETKDKAEVAEVADEIKLAAVLQRAIRDKKIETTHAIVTVPSKEILLRTFLIPVLPKKEINIAIDFEARKYVPIKLDDLYFDYLLQKTKDKKTRKLKTYFIGIKKDALQKFIYALEQSNLKAPLIEASSFSLFRVLLYKKLVKKNSNLAIIEVGKQEGSICIIDGGFPELIKDFNFAAISKDIYSQEPETLSSHLNKEVRLSFDYYRRQSQKEKINEIFLFTEERGDQLKENLYKEFNVPVIAVESKEVLGLAEDISLGTLKAFGVALRNSLSSPISIDLLRKRKVTELKERIELEVPEVAVSPKSVLRTAIIAICFIVLFYLFVDFSKISTLQNELRKLNQQKAVIKHKFGAFSLNELENLKNEYQGKIQLLKEASQTEYLTPLLNALPSLLPEGVWLTNINFSFDPSASLNLEGMAYLQGESEQINFVNKFFNNIKENKEFKQVLNQANLDFIRQRTIDQFSVAEFRITGR